MPLAETFFKARFADALRLLDKRVTFLIDVGCGAGIFLKELRNHCARLFACDIHPHLGLIKQMAEAEAIPVKLARSDARSLSFASGCIDAIVSMSTTAC